MRGYPYEGELWDVSIWLRLGIVALPCLVKA